MRQREKKTAVPTVTASLCLTGQDLSCAHSTEPAEGTVHAEWKMSKVICVCVCVSAQNGTRGATQKRPPTSKVTMTMP